MSNADKQNIAKPVWRLALGLAVIAALALAPNAGHAQRVGDLHIVKECSQYTGLAGSFCTITSSNVTAIPAGSTVNYDQPLGVPPDKLDSNVVLEVTTGNWAVGRCTLDLLTGAGLCTFADGT